MKTIWKYPVQITDHFTLNMPYEAKVLSVQSQRGEIQLWAEVDTQNFLHNRHFRVFGTGQPIPEEITLNYIGSFQVNSELLIFHLYEEITK